MSSAENFEYVSNSTLLKAVLLLQLHSGYVYVVVAAMYDDYMQCRSVQPGAGLCTCRKDLVFTAAWFTEEKEILAEPLAKIRSAIWKY